MVNGFFALFIGLTSLLPSGAAPDPVPVEHFPDTLHCFVWRNWNLVPIERLAETVQASPAQIREIGNNMGLLDPAPISEDQWQRSYITIIRRNWHLLPYEQLLTLLGWDEKRLAYTLREDDFLFVKLGRLKPASPTLTYKQPDEAAVRRASEIATIFGGLKSSQPSQPLFAFVETLSSPIETAPKVPDDSSRFSPRFCSSYFATYGDPLLKNEPDPYPDGYLSRLAASGVNGIWLQGVLYKLTPFPWDPTLSSRWEERLAGLKLLTEKAARHKIGVYLYLNEPRAMPLSFFQKRPDLRGVVEDDYAALCVSHPAVEKYLEEGVAHLCRHVPKLAGIFTITASENLTNCWSHHRGSECPRCGARGPEATISSVNKAIRRGIDQAESKTRLIAWDWGWKDEWNPGIIGRLPEGIGLMSVSEWNIPINRGGVDTVVSEYSISTVGPGPRALKNWREAARRELPTLAKVQINNTWELSSVPYIPAVANVARHIVNLRKENIEGLMLGWTLGGHPSPNLEVVAELGRNDDLNASEAMLRVAGKRFGESASSRVVEAWELMSEAFREFPYHSGTVYNAPLQMGPANLLYPEKTGYKATMVGLPYDDLKSWRSVYPPDIFISQLEKVAAGFDRGKALLQDIALEPKTSAAQRFNLEQEQRIAEVCSIHFQSVANQCRFILNRDDLESTSDSSDAASLISRLRKIIKAEITLATRLREIQLEDSRFGFEASNHYFYLPGDLAEKILNCRFLLQTWLPDRERSLVSLP